MSLKLTVSNIEEVGEGLRDLYTKSEETGQYVLDVDGAVPKERLDEFRTSNRALKTTAEDLATKLKAFDGVDLDEVQRLQAEAEKNRDKKLLEEGDVEKIVNERVSKVVKAKDDEIATLKQNSSGLHTQLERLLIDNELTTVAIAGGVQETAIPDVVSRGRQQYKIQEGSAVAVDADGNKVYGEDGVTPLSMGEWVKGLKTQAAHLFKGSSGSEAPGNTSRKAQPGDENLSSTDKIAAGLAQRQRA